MSQPLFMQPLFMIAFRGSDRELAGCLLRAEDEGAAREKANGIARLVEGTTKVDIKEMNMRVATLVPQAHIGRLLVIAEGHLV